MTSREPWPSRRVLWSTAAVFGGAGVLLLVRFPHSPWPALLVAAALACTAVALQRLVREHDRGPAHQRRVPRGPDLAGMRLALGRRPVLARGVLGLVVLAGLGGAAALWRFGPRLPTPSGWRDGVRLMDPRGRPVRAADLVPGGTVTVWPEGAGIEELATVVVLRLPRPVAGPTRAGATLDGTVVAYSRICTHAGCPVALFRAEEGLLYCPCHQATFDALRGAEPVFGPASRPLPQLPIGVDADGNLVARGDLLGPPGPGRSPT